MKKLTRTTDKHSIKMGLLSLIVFCGGGLFTLLTYLLLPVNFCVQNIFVSLLGYDLFMILGSIICFVIGIYGFIFNTYFVEGR